MARRGLIKDERRVVMLLQKTGGDGIGDVFFDGLTNDRRLVLAKRHDDDFPRLHDRADAHRQRLLRHVLFAEKVRGGIAARHRIERYRNIKRISEYASDIAEIVLNMNIEKTLKKME